MLAIDTSHSMGATRRRADTARRGPGLGAAIPRRAAEEVPRRRRRLQLARTARGPADAEPRVRRLGDLRHSASGRGRPSATGSRRPSRSRSRPAARRSSGPRARPPPPAAILVLSDGAQDGGRVKLSRRNRARRARRRCRSSPQCSAPRPASSRCRTSAASSSASRCRPNPTALRTVAAQTGGSFFAAPTQDDLKPVYADLKSRLGRTRKDEEITVAFAAAGALFLLVGGALSALWFRRVP